MKIKTIIDSIFYSFIYIYYLLFTYLYKFFNSIQTYKLVMDNANIHNTQKVFELIEGSNLSLIFYHHLKRFNLNGKTCIYSLRPHVKYNQISTASIGTTFSFLIKISSFVNRTSNVSSLFSSHSSFRRSVFINQASSENSSGSSYKTLV